MHLPLVSIITVTYQAESLIEATIRSVTQQDYEAIEHVLIDGGSSDNTVAIASACMRERHILISEKDNGLYDAMNKGLRLANGDFVMFLNAGDLLHNNQVISEMIHQGGFTDCIYGETSIIDATGQHLAGRRLRPPVSLNWKSFRMGMCVSHQSMLMRKSIAVPFDLNYRISADIDWSIRCLKRATSTAYCAIIVSDFLIGGVSAKNQRQSWIERWKIMRVHYGLWSTMWSHFKIVFRYAWQRLTRKHMY